MVRVVEIVDRPLLHRAEANAMVHAVVIEDLVVDHEAEFAEIVAACRWGARREGDPASARDLVVADRGERDRRGGRREIHPPRPPPPHPPPPHPPSLP